MTKVNLTVEAARRSRDLAIVTPVFNDWESLYLLVAELENIDLLPDWTLSLIIIDDGSTDGAPFKDLGEPRSLKSVEIITLVCNLGHQRAIAVGLVEAYLRKKFDAVVVMDSDGEDHPSDVPRLIEQASRNPRQIICAERGQRPGRLAFRVWYECYKQVFRILTGAYINFGNFCLIPGERLEALVTNASIWNNLAGTLARASLGLVMLPTDRGRRYAGRSKMNFVALVMHGLSIMAVYSDAVMVRLLLAALGLSAITAAGLLTVIFVKLFTNLGIPGWATSAAGILMIILVQALMLFTIAALNMMNARSAKTVIPIIDAPSFILSRRVILSGSAKETAE